MTPPTTYQGQPIADMPAEDLRVALVQTLVERDQFRDLHQQAVGAYEALKIPRPE